MNETDRTTSDLQNLDAAVHAAQQAMGRADFAAALGLGQARVDRHAGEASDALDLAAFYAARLGVDFFAIGWDSTKGPVGSGRWFDEIEAMKRRVAVIAARHRW